MPLRPPLTPRQDGIGVPRRRWLAGLLRAALGTGAGTALQPALALGTDDGWPNEATHIGLPPRLSGQGRMRFLGLALYDIRLWADGAVAPERWAEQVLGLEIRYARSLVGRLIAERSLSEMRRQPGFDAGRAPLWQDTLARLFPDVAAGDRLAGLYQPGAGVRFFHNGRLLGELADPLAARLFFGIWLSPDSSEPGLRGQLLGVPPP